MDGREQCAQDLMCIGCSWTTLGPSGPATGLGQNVQRSQLLPNEEQYELAHPGVGPWGLFCIGVNW